MGLSRIALLVIAGCSSAGAGSSPDPDAGGEVDGGPDPDGGVDDVCDLDGDGIDSIECGGDDCDDADPLRHPGAFDTGWAFERIAPTAGAYSIANVGGAAVDASGNVHAVWEANNEIWYAQKRSGLWTTEAVAAGDHPALDLGPSGEVHLSYLEAGGPHVHARRNGDAWAITEITSGSGFRPNAIAVDSEGAAHVCFRTDYEDGRGLVDDLVYATNASGAWVLETVDVDADSGAGFNVDECDVAVDGRGVHIAYDDSHDVVEVHELRYATNAGGAWEVEGVAPLRWGWSADVSIAVGSDGSVHVSYGDVADLGVARKVSGTWTIEVVHPDAEYASLALDAVGEEHVAFLDQVVGPSLASRTDSGWGFQSIDPQRGVRTKLAFDGSTPHVVHAASGEVRHAWLEPDGIDQDCDGTPDE